LASGKAANPRRRKVARRKRPVVAKRRVRSGRAGDLGVAALQEQLEQKTRELNEALEQQAATAEVLGVINASGGDLQPVFEAMVEKARRLCQADAGHLALPVGDDYRSVAVAAMSREMEELIGSVSYAPGRGTAIGRALAERRPVQISDIGTDTEHIARQAAHKGFIRTILGVPLLREGEAIGAFGLSRQRIEPFSERQIELVRTFADQAVIAIENTRLLNELRDSLEQQTATSEVLSVISSSPGELEPVFQAMLENATRICDAKSGFLFRAEDDGFRIVASSDEGVDVAWQMKQRTFKFGPSTPNGRAQLTRQIVHVQNLAEDQAYLEGEPLAVWAVEQAHVRTLLVVPMLKDEELIGIFGIQREEVKPFADKHIALVQNFAAQAVIAIENTRLLNELRQSLEQQTATADVLRVISSSPGNLAPVFQAMLENAMRICDASFGNLLLYDGNVFRRAALYNPPPGWERALPDGIVPRDVAPTPYRVVDTRKLFHVADMRLEAPDEAATKIAGARTLLIVPMIKEDNLVGAITIYRQEVRPFSDKQIEILENFAAQAVIAIENARLLNELRQRTDDLSEALEQQTATSEVLRVISSSPGELEPVFISILGNATRICQANFATLFLREGEALRVAAHHGSLTKAWDEQWRVGMLLQPDHELQAFQTLFGRQPLQVVDLSKAPSYLARNPKAVNSVETGGIRTMITVPMLKDGEAIGVITIFRTEVREFTEKQIALVTNFAAQAVIAIENTRLLNELRESLEQQTATADVLRVISSSPGELEPVFRAMLENATRICEAKFGTLALCEGDALRAVALHGGREDYADERRRNPVFRPAPNVPVMRAVRMKQVQHVADMLSEQAYIDRDAAIVTMVETGGARTFLAVPMLKDDEAVGVIIVYRQEVRPFTDKQIALVQNFAAQAVIAIENTRLLNELRQRTEDLSKSLEDLRTAQDRLVQTEKLASLGQLTAGIAHEIKNPLNFVNNFSSLSVELIGELQDELGKVKVDSAARDAITDVAETLKGNLEKIAHHGKRADAIVKNMLLHSREGSGDHRPVDVNALVEESLNLAYHGARAEKQGFNIALERSFDAAAGEVDLYPQEVTRVLLNIIANGFYAAHKRKSLAGGADFEPMLVASTRNLGDRVEIRIRDNGTGIPPEVREKMFNPFFTTKPAGEGTGLGLSISHDIIVKQHAGAIAVDTQPGQFTEFIIVLPRDAASAKPAKTA
jgi:GAF domain-containing protein